MTAGTETKNRLAQIPIFEDIPVQGLAEIERVLTRWDKTCVPAKWTPYGNVLDRFPGMKRDLHPLLLIHYF